MKTYRDWVQDCADRLLAAGAWFGHGTDNAFDESAWLVLAAIDVPVDEPFERWDETVNKADTARIQRLLQQRIESRKPLAYLLGEAWFCNMCFRVSESVLVPRSPLAELITGRFSPWVDAECISTALDLCTGSGCIALAMAKTMPWLRIDAADISPEALDIARENRELHGLVGSVKFWRSDLFGALQGKSWDLVVSNPPYVAKRVLETLPSEYHAEPELALVSELGGLEIPLRILRDAPDHLNRHGVLICEVGESQALLSESLPDLPLTWIEFEHGGEGVFCIGKSDLMAQRERINEFLEKAGHVA
jgi:ribosomal protein L3 glutamine methyltransferase